MKDTNIPLIPAVHLATLRGYLNAMAAPAEIYAAAEALHAGAVHGAQRIELQRMFEAILESNERVLSAVLDDKIRQEVGIDPKSITVPDLIEKAQSLNESIGDHLKANTRYPKGEENSRTHAPVMTISGKDENGDPKDEQIELTPDRVKMRDAIIEANRKANGYSDIKPGIPVVVTKASDGGYRVEMGVERITDDQARAVAAKMAEAAADPNTPDAKLGDPSDCCDETVEKPRPPAVRGDIDLRRKLDPVADLEAIQRRHDAGEPNGDIAEDYNVSGATVRSFLIKYGQYEVKQYKNSKPKPEVEIVESEKSNIEEKQEPVDIQNDPNEYVGQRNDGVLAISDLGDILTMRKNGAPDTRIAKSYNVTVEQLTDFIADNKGKVNTPGNW